ncbi:MAG: methyltransferase domain-containing protein [Halobacteriota archaeon]
MVDFNSVYQGDPPWDISRPQKEFVQLEKAGEIVGSVLDVGSGTGENALFLAAQGHEVWGVDFSPNAIKRARDNRRSVTSTLHFSRRTCWTCIPLAGLSIPSSTQGCFTC